ncbi:MAG: helix-turn-helix domain-containing protein, partial [Oscillospiraceae bacterium]|nr:helix-turn-helix domain-containing protein [Oscillospiraceae bacterium]
EDVLKLCHPKLLELVEYDRKHNTTFAKSLRAWFSNSRNITRTANALNLHRNSTIYHIKKIEEILGFTLGDADTLLYLELSFLLLEFNDNKFEF